MENYKVAKEIQNTLAFSELLSQNTQRELNEEVTNLKKQIKELENALENIETNLKLNGWFKCYICEEYKPPYEKEDINNYYLEVPHIPQNNGTFKYEYMCCECYSTHPLPNTR